MGFVLKDQDQIYRQIDYIIEDETLGEISWKEIDGIMHMSHTYVSPLLRGQGIAGQLLDEAALYARQHNLKMNAICSYVVRAFQLEGKYDDVQI
jgi:uncharacterized protein